MMTPEQIYAEATRVAETTAVYATVEAGGLNAMDVCGATWITIHPARGPFVNWLKSKRIGTNGAYGGWEFRNPASPPTQNLTIKEAVNKAFVNVLKENGVKATAHSRMT